MCGLSTKLLPVTICHKYIPFTLCLRYKYINERTCIRNCTWLGMRKCGETWLSDQQLGEKKNYVTNLLTCNENMEIA